MVTDPEAQGWNVTAIFKHPPESEDTVGDYRRSLVRSLGLQMFGARLAEIARQPNAPFLSADAGSGSATGQPGSAQCGERGAGQQPSSVGAHQGRSKGWYGNGMVSPAGALRPANPQG